MGWGTYFEAEIYLNRQIFRSESEVKKNIIVMNVNNDKISFL